MIQNILIEESLLRWQDALVIGINLCIMVLIGIYAARRTKSADAYFLAGRSMSGWVVGVSMMASVISSMTFLAMPAYTFEQDWRFMPAHLLYALPAVLAYFFFMPFFRKGKVRSAYEYLELRFNTWARIYAATAFTISNLFRVGTILYTVSLAFEKMLGLPLPIVIFALGVLIAIYTIAGGLEAVIYTDVLQGISLIAGGIICLPIILSEIPGGLGQLFTEAVVDGKFGIGSTALVLDEKTVWVIILNLQFSFLQYFGTDQVMIQRYLAMKTDADARLGLFLGVSLSIPVWFYFAFVGTALYVFYKLNPTDIILGMEPEAVYPYFILTNLPAGIAGFVIAALLAAAMSSIDSTLNALSSTVTTDFYRRFQNAEHTEQYYLRVGRWLTVLFSVILISIALIIHYARAQTILELNTYLFPVFSAGMLSLFLLGFFTTRIGSKSAAIAVISTIFFVGVWVFLGSSAGEYLLPKIHNRLPDEFWMGILPHIFLVAVAFTASIIFKRDKDKDLTGLTIWN